MWQVWLIISGIFFVVEMMTVGFLVFWFGMGAIITALVSIFINNLIIQTTIFIITSTLLLFLTKPFVNKISNKSNIQTNTYSIIGQKGIVIKEINEKTKIGQVKVGSEVWTAKSNLPIIEGNEVIIKEIDGVKVIVEPVLDSVSEPISK